MLQNEIEALLKPVINDLGYQLWGLEYLPRGQHALLRIYIDTDQGITLDDCTAVSRQVGAVLDVEDPITVNFDLEVSSPGLPRPLFYAWQYELYIGQDVDLKLFQPVLKKRKIRATLTHVNAETLTVTVDGESIDIPLTNIVKAYLTFE